MDYIFYLLGRYETFLINLAIAIVIFLFFFMLRKIFVNIFGGIVIIADAVVTVPNNTLANEPLTNWTRLFSQSEQIICAKNNSIAYSKTNFSSPTAL